MKKTTTATIIVFGAFLFLASFVLGGKEASALETVTKEELDKWAANVPGYVSPSHIEEMNKKFDGSKGLKAKEMLFFLSDFKLSFKIDLVENDPDLYALAKAKHDGVVYSFRFKTKEDLDAFSTIVEGAESALNAKKRGNIKIVDMYFQSVLNNKTDVVPYLIFDMTFFALEAKEITKARFFDDVPKNLSFDEKVSWLINSVHLSSQNKFSQGLKIGEDSENTYSIYPAGVFGSKKEVVQLMEVNSKKNKIKIAYKRTAGYKISDLLYCSYDENLRGSCSRLKDYKDSLNYVEKNTIANFFDLLANNLPI